ncbi:hypothetical protein [Luteolibacter luteus]|uniref:Gingipain domain-containing protein n=1 Tax=Luteolibacter luteus TaxID=2728835 RepID=A0A858RR34_9BACT|nr:hypothetical protein [Luteolibacter luteus]QJE98809.1 hypothetical protein HHL09_24525 [Luteolibacter luteus]
MKRQLLLSLLLALGNLSAPAADMKVEHFAFDVDGRFTVQAPLEFGSRHALLEGLDPATGNFRVLVSGAVDGRKGSVIFRLPANYGPKALVRIRTGTQTTVPAAQFTDPALFQVVYESPISEAVKISFLKEASTKMGGWSNLPRAEAQSRLIAWAQANPRVAAATLTSMGGTITIRFTDDDIVVLMPKRRGENPTGEPPPGEVELPLVPPLATKDIGPKATTGMSIPGSEKAFTAFSLESTFPSSTSKIASWLGSNGYKTTKYDATSVLDLMSWSHKDDPIGVLFWQIHGVPFERKDGTTSVALVTREIAPDEGTTRPYAPMRGTGLLNLAMEEGKTDPYYTITGRFVETYMRFAPNSLVMIDACYGGNADLANSFMLAGAGSYVSWDWLSGPRSGDTFRKVFDRLLGTNAEAPISTLKERAFSIPVIQHWMQVKGYDEDPSNKYQNQGRKNALLLWHHRQTNPAHMLKPSIMRVITEANRPGEQFTKYLLEGDFGDDPGPSKRKVMWGNQEMNVLRWDALNGIVVPIPDNPPGGNFQVFLTREHQTKSNEVPMTEWTIPFEFERTDHGALNAKMNFTVKFRADLRGERYEPEGQVTYIARPWTTMADCSGTLTASGVYRPDDDSSTTWSGSSDIRSYDVGKGNVPTKNIIHGSGIMTGAGLTHFFTLTANGSFTETYRTKTSSKVTERVAELDPFRFFLPPPQPQPPHWQFPGGNKTDEGDERIDKLVWPTVAARYRPDDNTPR